MVVVAVVVVEVVVVVVAVVVVISRPLVDAHELGLNFCFCSAEESAHCYSNCQIYSDDGHEFDFTHLPW